MGSPIGFHYAPNHRYERYLDAHRGANVALIMFSDENPSKDDYLAVKSRIGDGRIILRSYPWSDGGLDVLHRAKNDPVNTGRWMAEKWIKLANTWNVIDRAKTYFTGVNEYTVIPGMPLEPFAICEKVFVETLATAGYRGCIGNLGVGHPSDLNSQGRVDWSKLRDWEQLLQKTGSILGVHEYWRAEFGPRMNVKPQDEARGLFWYAWRFKQCPFDVPIVITEWGVDQKVNAPLGAPSQGWVGVIEADTYANQLLEAANVAAQDKRFCGGVIFTEDYAATEWASYDVDRAFPQILEAQKRAKKVGWYTPGGGVQPAPPVPAPPLVSGVGLPLPAKSYYITGYYSGDPAEKHNGIDLGAVAGTPVLAMANGEVAYVADHRDETPKPFNGGYGKYIRVWYKELGVHGFYAHLSKQRVKAGDKVSKGTVLGEVGTTGNSTGNHLHFEIRAAHPDGSYITATPHLNGRVDPETILALHGVSIKQGAISRG